MSGVPSGVVLLGEGVPSEGRGECDNKSNPIKIQTVILIFHGTYVTTEERHKLKNRTHENTETLCEILKYDIRILVKFQYIGPKILDHISFNVAYIGTTFTLLYRGDMWSHHI